MRLPSLIPWTAFGHGSSGSTPSTAVGITKLQQQYNAVIYSGREAEEDKVINDYSVGYHYIFRFIYLYF